MQRERLREFDITDAEHARLRGPVGLNIGSRTQPEIAISILAEMTAWKNGVRRPNTVSGRLTKSAWTGRDGAERSGFSVLVDTIASARTVRPGKPQGSRGAVDDELRF